MEDVMTNIEDKIKVLTYSLIEAGNTYGWNSSEFWDKFANMYQERQAISPTGLNIPVKSQANGPKGTGIQPLFSEIPRDPKKP
jgi:hypothetical protein